MDKQLLKAYIRTIVEEEVKRILPQLLSEAVAEVKQLSEQTSRTASSPKSKLDRSKLASMMGIDYDGQTLRATSTDRIAMRLPDEVPANADPEVVKAINRDYSQLMKKMGIV